MRIPLKVLKFLTIALAIASVNAVTAQSFRFDEDIPRGNGTTSNVQCAIDLNNNVVSFPWYVPTAARTGNNAIATSQCGGFTLIFEDVVNNTGQGYADPVQGPQMQNVACAVFEYISDVLVISGNPEVVFSQAYNNPLSNALASAQPLFNSTYTTGFVFCYMQEHIIGGSDPDLGSPDAVVNTNLAYPFNFNLTNNSTGTGQLDFYTILLHEALHALGYVSAIDQNGNGRINGAYTFMDRWMSNSAGKRDRVSNKFV
jgi:hypothetical protein